jgi:hypothetical protein
LQIPLEIVDVETTGYVLRLCPFESLAFSGNGLTDDDLEGFIVVSFCLISRKLVFSPKVDKQHQRNGNLGMVMARFSA